MKRPDIEAVVFDLDGVITDTAHYHYLAWKDLADKLNIDFDKKYNEKLKGVSRMQSLELILRNGNKEADFTTEEKEKLAAEKNELYNFYINQLTPKDILPGIEKLIDDIKSEGILIGLASASRNAKTVLDLLEITHLFDYCADANEIEKPKPDPEIFLDVCQALNVSPSKSIGVEDALVGVEAIQSGGMFAVGVGGDLHLADLYVPNTKQLDWNLVKDSFHDFIKK